MYKTILSRVHTKELYTCRPNKDLSYDAREENLMNQTLQLSLRFESEEKVHR